MRIGIYPGSFDPITYGHIDIINRASKIVDKLIVAVLTNPNKNSLFTIEERVDMVNESIKDIKNVSAQKFEGLLVNFAKKNDAKLIIRGLRAVSDYEYEQQLAYTNKILYNDIETMFLLSDIKYAHLSSSTVREVALFGGDISKFVLPYVADKIKIKYNN